jgi:type I site-specific restriction endonuclease
VEPIKPENLTRLEIDAKLETADWITQDKNRLNQFVGLDVIEREIIRSQRITALDVTKPHPLLQMATDSSETYTAVTQVYQRAKFSKINWMLFLVDHSKALLPYRKKQSLPTSAFSGTLYE